MENYNSFKYETEVKGVEKEWIDNLLEEDNKSPFIDFFLNKVTTCLATKQNEFLEKKLKEKLSVLVIDFEKLDFFELIEKRVSRVFVADNVYEFILDYGHLTGIFLFGIIENKVTNPIVDNTISMLVELNEYFESKVLSKEK